MAYLDQSILEQNGGVCLMTVDDLSETSAVQKSLRIIGHSWLPQGLEKDFLLSVKKTVFQTYITL